MKRRLARIAPLYLFAILLGIIPFLLTFVHTHQLTSLFWKSLIANVMFLQAYFPQYIFVINTPGWSLCAEMLFYLLFPFLLTIQKRNSKFFIGITIVIFVISQIVHLLLYSINDEKISPILFYNPIFHLNQFLVGIVAGYWFVMHPNKNSRVPAIFWLAVAVVLVYIVSNNKSLSFVSFHNGLLGPIFAILIVSIACKNIKFLKNKGLVYLGEISYGVYILQKPLHYIIYEQLNKKMLHWNDTGLFYSYLLFLILFSAFSFEIIEKPLRKKINSIRLG